MYCFRQLKGIASLQLIAISSLIVHFFNCNHNKSSWRVISICNHVSILRDIYIVHFQRHKVPVFTDERCKDSRWSVAFFSAPDNDAPLAPVDGSGPYNKYSGDTSKEYTDKLLNSYNERNALRFTE